MIYPTKEDALVSLRPGSEWVTRNGILEWLDKTQTQPSEEEIQQELQRLQAEYPKKVAKEQRALAYSQEADPIAFKMLRGEATKEEWEAKIEEIRQRYPYPS